MSVTLTCLLMKKNETPKIAAVSVVHHCASRIHLRFHIPAWKVKTSIFFLIFIPIVHVLELNCSLFLMLVEEQLSGSRSVSHRIFRQSHSSWGVAVSRNVQAVGASHPQNTAEETARLALFWLCSRLDEATQQEDGLFATCGQSCWFKKSLSGFPWKSPHVKTPEFTRQAFLCTKT